MRSKHVALTGFVIVTFVLYSLQQRHDASGVKVGTPVNKVSTSQGTPATSSTNSNGSSSTSSGTSSTASTTYKDGTYTGSEADAFYGNIQVQATVSGGKITDVVFLEYPNDQRNSVEINQQAMPILKQEAIQAQSANVDIVTGATDTSQAFVQSLSAALQKARA
ncbi:MAG TPA: FMN-binding protein [Candidatus Saccharimonadia bacterium]|nr:FMN-binding protein [Candidatus Saccharimonadia bacterium]